MGEQNGRTHYAGCWRSYGHHECAIAEIARLQGALREIVDPIASLRLKASAEGASLDGPMAVALSQDHNHLKSIAALALITSDSRREYEAVMRSQPAAPLTPLSEKNHE